MWFYTPCSSLFICLLLFGISFFILVYIFVCFCLLSSGKFVCGHMYIRDVRGGAFSSGGGAGWGEDENPRGGPGRGGEKKRVNQLIQNFDKGA